MAKVIGLIPASGLNSRLHGIPKFCLPLNKDLSFLGWHIQQLEEVCDIVKISVSQKWLPLVGDIAESSNAQIHVIEPSTMSDALSQMMTNLSDKHIISMPDTYVSNMEPNLYNRLATSTHSITLAAFKCENTLKGKVGQILLDSNDLVIDAQDKTTTCYYPYMWGVMALQNIKLNPRLSHPGLELSGWIKGKKPIKAEVSKGQYFDVGTFDGLKSFYTQ